VTRSQALGRKLCERRLHLWPHISGVFAPRPEYASLLNGRIVFSPSFFAITAVLVEVLKAGGGRSYEFHVGMIGAVQEFPRRSALHDFPLIHNLEFGIPF